MKAGISTGCFFPMEMEETLHKLGQQGINLCECFFNTPSELKTDSVRRLKAAAAFYGMEILSVHPFHSEMETFFFFTDYKNRLEDGLEIYSRYYEVAAELGAKYLIFHGDLSVSRCSESLAFEHIHTLWQLGKQYGIELLHENVDRCKGGQPAYLERLHQAIPELGFVLDCKQALRGGHSALEFVHVLGEQIKHIHISDSTAELDCLPPGKGTFDIRELFSSLKRRGADPDAVVELYSNSFEQVEELVASRNFIQMIMDDVNKYYEN